MRFGSRCPGASGPIASALVVSRVTSRMEGRTRGVAGVPAAGSPLLPTSEGHRGGEDDALPETRLRWERTMAPINVNLGDHDPRASGQTTNRLSPSTLLGIPCLHRGPGAAWVLHFLSRFLGHRVLEGLGERDRECRVTQAYGGPDSVPPGEFMPQLRSEAEGPGVVPGPRLSHRLSAARARCPGPPSALLHFEAASDRGAEVNLAVNFPVVFGDALAVLVLLWAFRGDPRTAWSLAAVYWIFP